MTFSPRITSYNVCYTKLLRFFAGLLDDPLLLVRVRPRGRNLLLDCGQLHHLAKRLLKGVEAIFVSHAHMDHFMA